MPVWRFRPHRADEKIRNPIQAEFFSEEAVERPAQALVREVIQNSLDARAGSDPVEVRFTVSRPQALGEQAARFWLQGAWDHLRAEGSGLRSVPERPVPGRFLVIEDFGTTGLDGEPTELRPQDSPSRLFAFFRAEGISQKGGRDAGRWGVGKTVFLRSSDISTTLGLTIRADGRCLVFGQSVLRYHSLNGTDFTPDGAFGEVGLEEAIVPSENRALASRLCRDFRLSRAGEPGLSVVVPYATEELTGPAILEAVMREYFYPILFEQLVVTVDDSSLLEHPRTLAADTLLDDLGMTSALKGSVGPLAALALSLWREGFDRATTLDSPRPGEPRWSAEMLPESTRDALAAEYQRGAPILIKVPLTVWPVGTQRRETFFHVVLRRSLDDRGAAPAFVRNGIQIPKALERRVRGHSLWALVVIDDQPIATLLGDAETPAHTHWSKDTQNFRNKYRYGGATIDFVRTAPRFIAETLTESARARDYVSLSEFFPVPLDGPAPERRPSSRPGDGAEDSHNPELPVPAVAYRIEALDGGFRISPTRSTPKQGRLSVSVAYDCTRGHPLKRWHPRDFDLGELPKAADGLRILGCVRNELAIEHDAARFRLDVTGFDPNRDLFVRITPLEEGVDTAP